MANIGIIDYGMGNLRSVQKAFEKLNVNAFISSDLEKLEKAEGAGNEGHFPLLHERLVNPIGQRHGKSVHGQTCSQKHTVKKK